MTVKELIEELSHVNSDHEVLIWDHVSRHEINVDFPTKVIVVGGNCIIDTDCLISQTK